MENCITIWFTMIFCVLFLSGCTEETHVYDKCQDDIAALTCNELNACDIKCNDEAIINWQLSCHAQYTNQMIMKCIKND